MRKFRRSAVIVALASMAGGAITASAHADDSGPLNNLVTENSSVAEMASFVRDHPKSFGGLYEDDATHTVHILTVAGGEAQQDQSTLASSLKSRMNVAASATSGQGWVVVTEPARYSLATLDGIRDQVTSRASSFADTAGNALSAWYADPRTDTVRMGLTKVTPALRNAAKKEFGDKVSVYTQPRQRSMDKLTPLAKPLTTRQLAASARGGAQAQSAAAAAPTRLLDSVPYAGGDRIVSMQTIGGKPFIVQCTTNFDYAMNNGTSMMGTAGHCGPTGLSWDQGNLDEATNTVNFTGTMGTAATRIFGNNKLDAELLNDSGNPAGFFTQVYIDNTTLNNVGSVAPVSVGAQACSDGSFTGQNCSGKVTAVDVCESINDDGTLVNICNLDIATASTRLVQSGDSGGPVYEENGSTLHPEGIISAGSSNGLTLDFTDIGFADIGLGGAPETTS
jgi:hypothetical protein